MNINQYRFVKQSRTDIMLAVAGALLGIILAVSAGYAMNRIESERPDFTETTSAWATREIWMQAFCGVFNSNCQGFVIPWYGD